MGELFQDYGFLGVVLSVITLFVTIVIAIFTIRYDRNKNKKRLGYSIDSNSPLIGPGISEREGWNITYEGHSVEDPYLLVMSFENLGRSPIRKEDFEEGYFLAINASSDTELISVSKIDGDPSEISPHGKVDDTRVEFKPLLLNSGDKFQVTVVTDGKCEPYISARIVGVKNIEIIEREPNDKRSRLMILIMSSIFLIPATYLLFFDQINESGNFNIYLYYYT